jgi:hypothetical protein
MPGMLDLEQAVVKDTTVNDASRERPDSSVVLIRCGHDRPLDHRKAAFRGREGERQKIRGTQKSMMTSFSNCVGRDCPKIVRKHSKRTYIAECLHEHGCSASSSYDSTTICAMFAVPHHCGTSSHGLQSHLF